MARALENVGCDVHIVAYHLGADRPLNGLAVHRIRKLSFYNDFSAGPNYSKLLLLDPLLAFRLAHVVRKHRIRIVHAHHFEGAIAALTVKRMAPWIRIIYDAHTTLREELMDYRFPMPRFLKKIASDVLDSSIPRWCDHVVTVSDALRQDILERGIHPDKVTTVPMGVNTGEFLQESKAEARRKLGFPETPVVLYTGGVARFQGIDRLLRAMKLVLERKPEVHLKMVGRKNPYYEEMIQRMGLASRVEIVGEKPFPVVRSYLAAADVVVLPRFTCIGFPLKLLNYMAAGKPIVAQSGAVGDVLHHLQEGYLVTGDEDEDFARGIMACLENTELSARMGQAARKAAETYDVAAVEQKVRELYAAFLPPEALTPLPDHAE